MMEAGEEEDKDRYFIELFVSIECSSSEFPEREILDSIDKAIRNKVLCYRESYKLSEIKSRIVESNYVEEEE
jgi:hypothetical protein